MKKLMLLALLVVLGSCKKEQEATEPENTVIIEVLSADVFETHLKEGNIQLIDVRTPKEFESGHLKGAKNHHIYRSEEHTSELQSRENLVCRLLLEKK